MANGRYVARQVDGYVGPVVFKQETPVPSSRVLARHNGRWELIDLGPELDDAILRVLHSGQYIGGGEIQKFETDFSTCVSTAHSVGCNSGTDKQRH